MKTKVETPVSEAPTRACDAPPLFDRYSLIGLADGDRETVVDAFIDAIATALACNDKLSLKDIDDTAKKIRRAISERTRARMFPGDNTIWDGAPFGVVDVDGIRLRHRAIGPPPAEDFELTKNLIAAARGCVDMDRVKIMEPEWLAEPLIAIRDPATGVAILVDGHHRAVRLWLDGVRTARAYILEEAEAAAFLFKTFAEFKSVCFRGETITKARLRVIFAPKANPR
jgi:hypothetical protein